MTNIVKFPGAKQAVPEQPVEAPRQAPREAATPENAHALVKGIWLLTVLVWPILKWILALDCVFHLFSGWLFFLHFGVFVAVTYFVSCYKPRGI